MNPNDEDWEKKMKEIIERKIKKSIKEKDLLAPNEVVIKPPFTKETLECPNPGKLKPSSIDPYDGTKDPIDHVQTFQSHMYYVDTSDAIIYRAFTTIFRMTAQN